MLEARQPILRSLRPLVKPGVPFGQDDVGDFLSAVRSRAGHRCEHDGAGDVGAGIADEDFRTVDDPVIAVEPSARGDIGCVRPRIGFRERDSADLAAIQDRPQETLLLLVRAVITEQACHGGVGHHRIGDRAVDAREFLEHDDEGQPFAAAAAIGLGIGQPVNPSAQTRRQMS